MEQTIPTGWQVKRLGDICSVSAGNSAPQDAKLFENGKHPFFRTSDVGSIHFGTLTRSFDNLNDEGVKGLKLFKKGTILFPKSGASTFLNHRVKMGTDGYVVSHLATIKANNDTILDDYLLYYLTLIDAKKLIQDGGYPSLNLPIISNIPVYYPSLPEQERIVNKLNDVMDKIEHIKHETEFTLSATKDLFESTLSNVFKNNTNNWREETLTNVINKVKYTTKIKSKMYLKEGLFPIVSQEENFISGYWNDSKDLFRVKNPVVIFGDHTKVAKYIDFDFILGADGVKILDPKPFINAKFLYYWVKYVPLRNLGYARHFKLLSQKTISFPPLEEQVQIVKVLDKLQDKLKQYEEICKNKLKLLEDLKQSVLKQAFAGEL